MALVPYTEIKDPSLREVVRQQDVRHCRQGAIFIAHPHLQTVKVIPMSCGAWDCPNCGPRKVSMWRHRIISAEPNRFITFTRNPKIARTPMQAYHQMKQGFPAFIRKIRSRFGKFEFCAFWELHKDGFPHLHVVQKGRFVPWKWLKAVAPHFGFGPSVTILNIYSKGGCAKYISKELTKMTMFVAKFRLFKRIVWHSRHFFTNNTTGVPQSPDPDDVKVTSDRPLCKLLDDLVHKHGFIVDSDADDRAVLLHWNTEHPDPKGFVAIIKQVALGC